MIDKILQDREKTHGSFEVQSRISIKLKNIVKEYSYAMNHVQAEALDMILHKIARICAGDPNYIDHWADIAGYAKLVAKSLSNKEHE